MRVLNLMMGKSRGGLEAMALRYHEALQAAGFDVLSAGHPQGMLAGLSDFRPLTTRFSQDPFSALKLKAIANRFRADLVIVHGNRALFVAAHPWAGLAGKTLAVVHNFRAKATLAKVRGALCVSPAVKQDVEQTYPALAAHLMENFLPLAQKPVKAPPEGLPVVGALGRLHVNKGFDILLQAAALLRERGKPVKLQIAGDGPEEGNIRTLAARLGFGTEDLTFTGWVTGPADYLAKLDLFVLPSRVEPFGLVVVEAMAAGVPVISSDIDGPRTILKSGELGVMVPPENPSALADAIAAALADWPRALERARKAQAQALEIYDQAAGQRRLTALLQELRP